MTENEFNLFYEPYRNRLINAGRKVSTSANNGRGFIVMYHNRVAGVCVFGKTAHTVAEHMLNTEVIYAFGQGGMVFQDIQIELSESFLYRRNARLYERYCEPLKENMVYHMMIVNQKIAYIDKINNHISNYRTSLTNSIRFQDDIYDFKYQEAVEIKQKSINEDNLLEYPFVSGYAELQGISLQEAADRIIFSQKNNRLFLSESENLRMKYTRYVLQANTLEDLESINSGFLSEYNKYGCL